MKAKKKVTKKQRITKSRKKFSKNLLIGLGVLFVSLFVIVTASRQNHEVLGIAQTAITPTFGAIGDCQTNGTCPTGTPTVAITGSVPVITTPVVVTTSPTNTSLQPCVSTQNAQVSIMANHGKKHGHGNNGNGFLQQILQFFMQLLQLLQQLLGGGGTPPTNPIPTPVVNQPSQGVQQPSTSVPQPTQGTQPTTVPNVTQMPCPPTSVPQPTVPSGQQPTSAPTNIPNPTSPPVGTACVTSAPDGFCPGPNQHYNDPNIYGNTGNNIYVANNIAFPIAGATETLTAYGAENWSAVANVPAGNTSVVTAPQTRIDYATNAPAPLSNFNALYSSFAETMQQVSGVAYDAGFDLWGGVQGDSNTNFKYEMMIWTDQVKRGTCGGATKLATTSFGGTHGAPVQNWTLCQNGSEMIWYLSDASGNAINEQTGTVDIKPMVQYMISHGYYPSNYGVNQLDFTNEICSTGGVPAKFTVSKFTVSGN